MKCFYHNDLDGRCAGSIVARFENNYNKEDYFEVDYVVDLSPMLDKIQDGERVYFVDYSFKENTLWVLKKLIDKKCDIIWADHHTSSLNLVENHPELNAIEGIRQDGISGAGLIYMYLYDCLFEDLPFYIKLVSDYDCWIYNYDTDTTHFKIGIEMTEYDALDKVWIYLSQESENPGYYSEFQQHLDDIITRGATIKNYIDKDNEQYRKSFAYESSIDGHKCLVVNKKSNSWIFGERYYEYPLVMVWVFNGDKYIYSIFSSREDINCAEIAEKFGGGGHKGAAGFSSDELIFTRNKGE